MSGKEIVQQTVDDLRVNIGKAALHALFPNDFEYYMIALELVDSKGYTVDYLNFPVNPNQISQTEPQITSIKQSFGGVTILKSRTFVPKDIRISGDFGRAFKILIQPFDKGTFRAFGGGMSVKDGVWKKHENPSENKAGAVVKKMMLNSSIKTGYGCTKLLQAICDKSGGVDLDGNPLRLYLYNMTLGESYLVEVINATFDQNKQSSNMIWQYSLNLKAVAPITKTKKSSLLAMSQRMLFSILQQGATQIAQEGKSAITSTLQRKTNDVVRSTARKAVRTTRGKV